MLSSKLIFHFEKLLGESILNQKQLSDSSINTVMVLETKTLPVVVKINDNHHFPQLFKKEVQGLEILRESKSFYIPKVLAQGNINSTTFLLMQYIPSKAPDLDFWEIFGFSLARLHANTAESFGHKNSNYIGRLKQNNALENSAIDFYINQRLEPQFKLANQKGYVFNTIDTLYKNMSEIIPEESPALIHGDLWNGNFICNAQGLPALIDPAVAYAPREMDLAMMHLFGGFPKEVFEIYHENFPLLPNWKERLPLWQLYYLLVHLNLFGSSYLQQVKTIIKSYS